ncbi:hypothetical protein K502DRAFT_283240, partial [Neoconidiobolus thromboides FSU 785]
CTKHLTTVEYWIGGQQYMIHQHNDSLDHGTTLWDSSKVLALYFYQLKKNSKIKPTDYVLELGAGTGLSGILTSSLGLSTIITDQEHIVSLLKLNAKLNISLIPKIEEKEKEVEMVIKRNCDYFQTSQLDLNPLLIVDRLVWGDQKDMERYQKLSLTYPFKYILAADCIYDINILEFFLETLDKIVIDSKTIILISLEPRDPFVVETFVKRAKETGFSVTKINKSKLPPPYNVNDAPCEIYKLKK